MPSAEFFRNLGLFIQEGFFDSAFCARLKSEMCSAPGSKAKIADEKQEILDETVRQVMIMKPDEATRVLVMDQILALKPALEHHFRVSLADCEKPQYLLYNQGAFYKWHIDSGAFLSARERQVSIVVFLNRAAKEPAPDCYGGGSLSFQGLMEGPVWEDCAFPLEAQTGMLIAFRSNLMHEVEPVTFGQRFTIATWFSGVE
jgi:SM-20-related protein